jgi:hypothetical protein
VAPSAISGRKTRCSSRTACFLTSAHCLCTRRRPLHRRAATFVPSRALLKEAVALSCAPRVVDLTKVRPGKACEKAKSRPERQLAARHAEVSELLRKMDTCLKNERETSVLDGSGLSRCDVT